MYKKFECGIKWLGVAKSENFIIVVHVFRHKLTYKLLSNVDSQWSINCPFSVHKSTVFSRQTLDHKKFWKSPPSHNQNKLSIGNFLKFNPISKEVDYDPKNKNDYK